MADLNALIAQGVQFRAPPDPFAQYAQMQQLQQGEQANQLNQMKMQEYQRGMAETNALRQLDPSSPTYLKEVMKISPEKGYAFSKLQQEAGTAELTQQKTRNEVAIQKRNFVQQAQRDTSRNPSDANVTAFKEDLMASDLFTDAEKAQMGAGADRILAMPVGERQAFMASQGATAGDLKPQVVAPGASLVRPGADKPYFTAPAAPDRPLAPPAMVGEYNFAKTPEGGGFRGSYQDFVTARAAAGRAPAMPRPEQPPVAVVDPVTGKQVLVSREEALKNRMTPASAMEGLAPKEIQQREAKYPQATSAIKTFESKTDSLATDMEKLANHPGLSGISGLIYGRTPALTKDALAAQALYDSIVARGGFAELQAMRASSPTGGALGNVSNQEGQYLRDAFAPISRTQDTGDLKTALKNAANVARASKQRVRDAYDMTYEYKTQSGAPAAAPAAAPNIDALLNKYK